jgi:putative Mn2+ efflux pump MntP
VRVAIVFGLFEAPMPVIGLALGHQLADTLASTSRHLGAALPIAAGLYTAGQAVRSHEAGAVHNMGLRTLVLAAAALSIDNLVIGFALGTQDVDVVSTAHVIGIVSVALSLAGLELGSRVGRRVGARSGEVAGPVLVAVGVAIAVSIL